MGGHRPARLQEQNGENRPLFGRSKVDRNPATLGADLAEDLEPKRCANAAVGHRNTP
ncbi:hypothetical protein Ari01nite_77580 [Paractinoplanes rishiriensis]|uniref:Uncharacterized protein n=1 Tax=Paractinoplanes rishiriensis TaxID=1050105 RepID=A0A919K874_9ACTN|nr:hypothetical protein Ari01nite_77580 [Actinoplanes rishiriensis]